MATTPLWDPLGRICFSHSSLITERSHFMTHVLLWRYHSPVRQSGYITIEVIIPASINKTLVEMETLFFCTSTYVMEVMKIRKVSNLIAVGDNFASLAQVRIAWSSAVGLSMSWISL